MKLENGVKEKREKITGLYTEKQTLVNTSAEARTNLQAAERTLNDLRSEFSRKRTGSTRSVNSTRNVRCTRPPCKSCSPSNQRSASSFGNSPTV
ncbi:MAG: hypothetical protein IPJ30_08710 [Acidobacteria bacterium]|nr:hypothetical protein [Acidobacteriota bacterium]